MYYCADLDSFIFLLWPFTFSKKNYSFLFVSMFHTNMCNTGYKSAHAFWWQIKIWLLCYVYYIYRLHLRNYIYGYRIVRRVEDVGRGCYWVCMGKYYSQFLLRCQREIAHSPKVIYSKKDNINDFLVIEHRFCGCHMYVIKIKRLYPLLSFLIVIINQYCIIVFVVHQLKVNISILVLLL